MSAKVLLVERPGEFRDGFVRAVSARGGSAEVRDDAMQALGSLPAQGPSVVLVSEDPGPPGAGSLCRILRRRYRDASVYRLGDPALRDVVDPTSAVLPRALGAELVAHALLEAPAAHEQGSAGVPRRAFEAPLGQMELGPLLVAIAERWLTGRLLLTTGSSERELRFVRGLPTSSRSTVFAERLGAVAVRLGLLSQPAADNASDLARARGLRLGEALLELGVWQGHELWNALCAQLLDSVVAACNGPACQARFVMDDSVADEALVMRLHPLTALLAACRRMAAAELAAVLEPLGEGSIAGGSSARCIDDWLADLGIAEASALWSASSVKQLRERVADALPPAAADDPLSADAVTLALLRAGAVKFSGGRTSLAPLDLRAPMPSQAPPSLAPGNPAPAILASALQRASRASFETWPVTALAPVQDERDRALNAYLHSARPPALARALALRGPSAEANAAHAALLASYLRVRAGEPQAWLGAREGRSAHQQLMAAHQLHHQLDALAGDGSDQFARSKVAELRVHLDCALAQLPATEPPLELGPVPAELTVKGTSVRAPRPSKAPPPPARIAASLPPAAPPARHTQSLAAFPEAEQLVLHGKWSELRSLLAEREADPTKLPPVLGLVYAIALKEEARPDDTQGIGQKRLDPDALGIHAMSQLLGVPEDSAAALVIAKRTLRRRPLEWNQNPPARISFLLVAVALAIGAGVGLLLNPTVVHLPWK